MTDQKVSLCRMVIVTTPEAPINGQESHAAVVTQVWEGEGQLINVMLFPGAGDPIPRGSVIYADPPHPSYTSWRWPPRV